MKLSLDRVAPSNYYNLDWYFKMAEVWASDDILSMDGKANGDSLLFPGNRETFHTQAVGTVMIPAVTPHNRLATGSKKCSGAKG